MEQKSGNPILLVEDNEVDVITVQRAFKKLNIQNKIYVVQDGVEALRLLQGYKETPPLRPIPSIILLDLNMPRMGGIEFLLELQNHDFQQQIEVIVLTTSNWYNDKIKAFDLGIAGYLVKPVKQENLRAIIRTIRPDYWLLDFNSEN